MPRLLIEPRPYSLIRARTPLLLPRAPLLHLSLRQHWPSPFQNEHSPHSSPLRALSNATSETFFFFFHFWVSSTSYLIENQKWLTNPHRSSHRTTQSLRHPRNRCRYSLHGWQRNVNPNPSHGCAALPAGDYVNDSRRRTFVSKP